MRNVGGSSSASGSGSSSGGGSSSPEPELAIVFVSAAFGSDFDRLVPLLRERLPSLKHVFGCSVGAAGPPGGIVDTSPKGGGMEGESGRWVVVWPPGRRVTAAGSCGIPVADTPALCKPAHCVIPTLEPPLPLGHSAHFRS